MPVAGIGPASQLGDRSLITPLSQQLSPPLSHGPVVGHPDPAARAPGTQRHPAWGRTTGGGLTATLRNLGIHNAAPNWASAWDSVRAQTTNALTTIRTELRQQVDATTP